MGVSYARPEFADNGNHRLNGLDKITYKRRARNKFFSRKQTLSIIVDLIIHQ